DALEHDRAKRRLRRSLQPSRGRGGPRSFRLARPMGGRPAFSSASGRQLQLSELPAAPLPQQRQRADEGRLDHHATVLLSSWVSSNWARLRGREDVLRRRSRAIGVERSKAAAGTTRRLREKARQPADPECRATGRAEILSPPCAVRYATRLHRVLGGFDWPCPHDLPRRLGLEHGRLLGEGIDALARLGGRLLDDNELREARQHKRAGLLELFVSDAGERLEHALYVLLGELALGCDPLDQLR